MSADWQKADPGQGKKILEKLNDQISPVPFDLEKTTVRQRTLPFYPKSVKFYELTDLTAVPAARKYALMHGDDVYMINWTNAPVYSLNKNAPISLNAENVADYVRFFFSYVRGRHGRFIVIETFEDIKWQNEPPASGRKALREMLSPISIVSQDSKSGDFELEGFMLFKDALFNSTIRVKADGSVDMTDEDMKVEGMPVIQAVQIA